MASYPPHRFRDAFVVRMRELYQSCRVPSLAHLERTCGRLPKLYPDLYPDGKKPSYVKGTFSKLLNGKQRGLPGPDPVKAFFLGCRTSAMEAPTVVPDLALLAEWHLTLERYEDLAQAAGLYARRGYQGDRGRTGAAPVLTSQGPPVFVPQLARISRLVLPGAQREALVAQGPYARALADRIDQGDADAFYRGALLLSGDSFSEVVVTEMLTAAGTVRHLPALELLEAAAHEIDRFLARSHLVELAEAARGEGDEAAAALFRACAARLTEQAWSTELPAAPEIRADPPPRRLPS